VVVRCVPVWAEAVPIGTTVGPGQRLLVEFHFDPAQSTSLGLLTQQGAVADDVVSLYAEVGRQFSIPGTEIGRLYETDGTLLGESSFTGGVWGRPS